MINPALHPWLSSKLIFVTGKGGTGKSTCAAAMAHRLSEQGRRTLLVEIDSQHSALEVLYGRAVHHDPQPIARGLDIANLQWRPSLETYLTSVLKVRALVRSIVGNEAIARFLDVVPGSQEIIFLHMLDRFRERYDHVVVDMPASGHAFSMLDITRSALALFKSGPVRRRATELRRMIQRPDTLMVLVAIPEQMVINETIETADRLRESELLGREPLLLLNRAWSSPLQPVDQGRVDDLLAREVLSSTLQTAGAWRRRREQAAEGAVDRLRSHSSQPVQLLPELGLGRSMRSVFKLLAEHLSAQEAS